MKTKEQGISRKKGYKQKSKVLIGQQITTDYTDCKCQTLGHWFSSSLTWNQLVWQKW